MMPTPAPPAPTELGGEVLSEPVDVPWSRVTSIRDPQGATLTLSQFKPRRSSSKPALTRKPPCQAV